MNGKDKDFSISKERTHTK